MIGNQVLSLVVDPSVYHSQCSLHHGDHFTLMSFKLECCGAQVSQRVCQWMVKLLTFCSTMSQVINLNGLSREELLDLAGRIEERPKVLPQDTSGRTVEAADARRDSTLDDSDPWAAPHGTSSEESPGIQTTLSEKVQELNYVNDPWEGSGIGRTRWSLPFYGGHIVRTPEVLMRVPSLVEGPQVLPVFGGPPCATFGGKTPQHRLLMLVLPLNPRDVAGRRSVFNLVLFAFLHAALAICPMVYTLVSGIDCSSPQTFVCIFWLYSFRLLGRSHTELTWIETKACCVSW